jgi:hypothetical protein
MVAAVIIVMAVFKKAGSVAKNQNKIDEKVI